MIQAEHLQKTFHVRKRNAGFKNAAKAFFSREYEEIHALNDVSFRIEDGEAVGYIGPNGAGKSSTIKILLRHFNAGQRHLCHRQARAVERPPRACFADRRCVRAAQSIMVGRARHRFIRAYPRHLRRDRRCLQAKFTGFNRPSEFIGDLKDPGAQPVARAAYAVRDRRLPAARPAHLVFG